MAHNRFFLLLVLFFSLSEARIKFIHIPKTGGSTIHEVLSQYFYENQIYPYRRINRALSPNAKKKAEAMPSIQHELVSGHFPYWFMEEKDKDKKNSFTFTVLRNPIERVFSHYRFRKKANPDLDVSIEDVLKNWTCRMLCSDPKLTGMDLLENAIENLKKLDFVIFMDNFDEDTKTMLQMIGIDTTYVRIPKLNTTKKERYDQKNIEQVKEDHALDVALYQYAKDHLSWPIKKYPQKYKKR